MLVQYNKPRVLGFGAHLLKPGANEIPVDVVAAMQDDPIMQEKFDSREIELIDVDRSKLKKVGSLTPGQKLAAMDKVDALALVTKTADLEVLEDWLAADKRKSVRVALREQIGKIKNPEFRDHRSATSKPAHSKDRE